MGQVLFPSAVAIKDLYFDSMNNIVVVGKDAHWRIHPLVHDKNQHPHASLGVSVPGQNGRLSQHKKRFHFFPNTL